MPAAEPGPSSERLELAPRAAGERLELLSPAVGIFTCALPAGSAVAPFQEAGVLLCLGRAARLVVPAGVHGIVTRGRPERVHAPVGHGEPLYELAPLLAEPATAEREEARRTGGALVLASPQTGRFYHRPAPGAPPFVEAGSALAEGQPVGLIEVMKTFAHVPYRGLGSLPERARVVRLVAADGADVREGEPLLEVEPDERPRDETGGTIPPGSAATV